MSLNWDNLIEYTFSTSLQEKVTEITRKIVEENTESDISEQWLYLNNFRFKSTAEMVEVDELLSQINSYSDINEKINLAIESIETQAQLEESNFKNLSMKSLCKIFCQVGSEISEVGFTSFCKVLSTWTDENIVKTCFNCVILRKLQEKEEASLSTINAVTDLAKQKPTEVSNCFIALITEESRTFTDKELLEKVFDVLPPSQKDVIIKSLLETDKFRESYWHLLQVVILKATSSSLKKVIDLMDRRCEEFANSQVFTRLLLHISKNFQPEFPKDVLLNIIGKNKTLLKKQALKYLSSA